MKSQDKISLLGFLLLILFGLAAFQSEIFSKEITIVNVQVEKEGNGGCKYTIIRRNHTGKNPVIGVHINLLDAKGKILDHFDWKDETLISENPRTDYLFSDFCPSGGVSKLQYILSNGSFVIANKKIDVPKNLTE